MIMKIKDFIKKASVRVKYFMYQEQLNGYQIVGIIKDLYDIITHFAG